VVGGGDSLGGVVIRAYDWISVHGWRTPDKVAAIDHHTGRRFTYAQFDLRIGRLAATLRRRGICRGDRVAVLSPNSTSVFELQFACARLGAIMLPLNWRLAAPELEFIVRDARPELMLADPEHRAAADALGVPVMDLEDGREGERLDPGDHAEPALDDVVTILYTAGTTGRPKGALITHRMNLFNAINIGMATRLTCDSTHLTILPTFHTGGLNLLANPCFHLGGTVIVQRTFEPGETLRLLADPELGVTHFFGVPANYLLMGQHAAFPAADLGRVVYAGVGGAPAPLPLLELWASKGCALTQGWGMTETGPSAIVLGADKVIEKQGSCGLPLMHVEARIADAEGRDVPRGETGELLVRGPSIAHGYWNRPEATEEVWRGGWFHTGDAARQDSAGYFYIVDRWKDMYISGGENVYPAEVENVIYGLDAVAEAAVIGVPDERWGEVGRAIVVLKAGRSLTEAEVIEHCASRLAKFKVPRSVVFADVLPRNAAGKVLKRELAVSHGG
jgi:fatty-acyl-CoA synthase